MSKEDWVEEWVRSIPKPKPGNKDEVDVEEMPPNQDLAAELHNNQDAKEGGEIVKLQQTRDMLELAERGVQLSCEIKAVTSREEKLGKRVKEKQAKVNEKRNSVIMLRNVLKLKKEEVAKLRRSVAAGRGDRRWSEHDLATAAKPMQQQKQTNNFLGPPAAWLGSAGLGRRMESGKWRENCLEKAIDVKTGHCARTSFATVESCVEMENTGFSPNFGSCGEEFDQESRDWLARRQNAWDQKKASTNISNKPSPLERGYTWDSKRVSNRSPPFKRTLSAPLVGKVEPEVDKINGKRFDQESRDWQLKRGNVWDSKRALKSTRSPAFKRTPVTPFKRTPVTPTSNFKRTLSAPSADKVESEVEELEDDSVAAAEWRSLLRRGTPPNLQSVRHSTSARCYSCHEPGHFARDCPGRKQTAAAIKQGTPRPISSLVNMRRRSYEEGGAGGYADDGALRDVSGRISQSLKTSDFKKGVDQLSRSKVGQHEEGIVDESRQKVCAPRSWSKFTMDGMIADILSEREQ